MKQNMKRDAFYDIQVPATHHHVCVLRKNGATEQVCEL